MRALTSAYFPGITTRIDDNVDISRAKLESTSIIFFQLKLSNRERFSEKNFDEIFTFYVFMFLWAVAL